MSGHMTIMSRGCSVSSSASACRIASRSTSTWRARPWHAWICRLWSPASMSGRGRGSVRERAAPAGRRSAETSRWIRASSGRALRSTADRGGGRAPVPSLPARRRLPGRAASHGRPGPRRRAAGSAAAPAVGSADRLIACPRAGRRLGDRPPQRGGGMQQQEMDLALRGQRPQYSRWPAGSLVSPNSVTLAGARAVTDRDGCVCRRRQRLGAGSGTSIAARSRRQSSRPASRRRPDQSPPTTFASISGRCSA